MGMLQTIEEIKELEIETGVVVNGIDNPNRMSVDSTEPVETKADGLIKTKEEEEKEVEKKVEKEEKKAEKKPEEKTKEEEEAEVVKKIEDEKEIKSSDSKVKTDSKNVQKRIGALTKRLRTAERERDFAVEKQTELETKVKAEASKIPDKAKPQKIDFDDEDDYIEALTDWKIDAKLKDSQANTAKIEKETNEKKIISEEFEGLDAAIKKGKEKYDDFNDLVLDEDLIISPNLTKILLDTDYASDIMYYLANNPDEAERLSGLSTVKAAREVFEIESGLFEKEEKTETKPETKVKKQTNAPAPIESVRTDGVVEKDPMKMSPKEYRAWRERKSK